MTDGQGLRVEGLTRRFGKKVAVDGLSFGVGHGELVGLLGPNGAGKSTTLLCLAGLLRPDAGTIAFDGLPLGSDRGRTLALIPETPDVYPMLTVWEHLVFVAKSCRLHSGWERRAEELLDRLALQGERDTLGHGLSKGMRQKTLIAATIIAGAPALMLDEPMIGLDPKGQRELRTLLRELCAEGIALLMSTHLLESAEALCDRIVIMKDGREVAAGSITELRNTDTSGRSLEDVFLEITA